ncbi:hypothetical protein [Niveispirillum fermenti]|uniref:hypothetical protein n=1 Tax=Niveispirillum fermenti TaxID=1233113 RepID=UPI003A8A4796
MDSPEFGLLFTDRRRSRRATQRHIVRSSHFTTKVVGIEISTLGNPPRRWIGGRVKQATSTTSAYSTLTVPGALHPRHQGCH